MRNTLHTLATAASFAVAAMLLAPVSANAQGQKVSLEQAWHECLKVVRAEAGTDTGGNMDQVRTMAFKACMTKMGHAGGR